MARSSRKAPYDPAAAAAEAIARAEQRAAQRALERQARGDPAQWGVPLEQLQLETANDVVAVVGGTRSDGRRRVQEARRLDAFDELLKRGGLDRGQHQAVGRLMVEVAARNGIRTTGGFAPDKIDGGDASELVTQRMIDAGRRVDQVLRLVGLADAQLLRELVQVVVFEQAGVKTNWRGRVQTLTGETNKMVQGGRVRSACENLRLAWEDWDRMTEEQRHRLLPEAWRVDTD